MQLENVQAVIRPRTSWEATDLGILLARRWWWPLTKSWLLLMVPMIGVAQLLDTVYETEWGWPGLLLLWWIKPAAEVLQLQWLSRALFGEEMTLAKLLQGAASAWRKQLPTVLFMGRLSRTRSLDAPVHQLEGLQGQQARERMALLHREDIDPCAWMALGGMHLEAILFVSVPLLLAALIPGELDSTLGSSIDLSALLEKIFYCLAMMLVAPFYVASGFALYLNRRIKLEGWDLELAFRRMVKRQQSPGRVIAVALFAVAMCASVPTETVWAAEASAVQASPEQVKQALETVLDGEDFHRIDVEKVPVLFKADGEDNWLQRWLRRWLQQDGKELSADWLQGLVAWLEVLLWLMVLGLIGAVIYHRRHWLQQLLSSQEVLASAPAAQRVLVRSDQSKQHAEVNPVADSRALWAQGQQEAALALLYRSVLQYAAHHYQQTFSESSTEGEHLLGVRAVASVGQTNYFMRLQRLWLFTAYGKQAPALGQMDGLWQEWPLIWPTRQQAAKTDNSSIAEHGAA
jgi:hypothetical protein